MSFIKFVMIALLVNACGKSTSDSTDNTGEPETIDEIDLLDPLTDALETYEGITNPIGVDDGMDPIPCSVYLMAKSDDGSKLYYRTNFGHDEETHPYVIVDFLPDQLQLQGLGSNGSDIMFLTLTEANNYQSLTAIKLRWKHGSHFHTSNCHRLELTASKTP